MRKTRFKYIYGPVSSWRLGSSLGIDPVSLKKGKICSFDCVYCQQGKTNKLGRRRKVFVPTSKIIEEIKRLPPVKIDYITFSGAGEPTLAENLGEIIKKIKKIRREKIAILTNSSLIDRKDVRRDLELADLVVAKIDAHSQRLFEEINKPLEKIKFADIIKDLKKFRKAYKGKLVLQIMFINKNKKYAREIASLAGQIRPDEIHLNTPLRECGVKPLSRKALNDIKVFFKGTNYISVYDAKRKHVKPVSGSSSLKIRCRFLS